MIEEIKKQIKKSEEYLESNGTTYADVLTREDTEEFNDKSEDNNYEAGRISAFNEVLEMLEE